MNHQLNEALELLERVDILLLNLPEAIYEDIAVDLDSVVSEVRRYLDQKAADRAALARWIGGERRNDDYLSRRLIRSG